MIIAYITKYALLEVTDNFTYPYGKLYFNFINCDEKDQNKNQKHGFRESENEREQNAHTVRKYCTTSTVSPDITHATECLITFASTHDIAVCAHGVSLRLLCLGGCYVLRYALPNWGSKTGN